VGRNTKEGEGANAKESRKKQVNSIKKAFFFITKLLNQYRKDKKSFN